MSFTNPLPSDIYKERKIPRTEDIRGEFLEIKQPFFILCLFVG